eukprot:NODE_1949_length_1326_cov_74.397832_g1852_i0.p1 GENE.NODE_1949_length_1326_cov_74.397832_g1852_i0~~NODE_1949_length_1326_cov_74.397832_g1852_i0.p1  ORF type:complete len:422 (+),score=149.40 NODE_1949_length_1326_cov_74.397832_g1852_i0:52-1266(+)
MSLNAGDYAVLCCENGVKKLVPLTPGASCKVYKGCTLPVNAVLGTPMGSLFQADPKKGVARLFDCGTLYSQCNVDQEQLLETKDNSELVDCDGHQTLTQEEVEGMKGDAGTARVEIVEQLVSRSRTYDDKTVFAKQKYVTKKQKKYCPLLTLQPPSPAYVCETLQMNKGRKVVEMRVDTLSQLLRLANIHHNSHVMCVDGCTGLLTGTVLSRLSEIGRVYHVVRSSATYVCHLQTIPMMNMESKAAQCLTSVDFQTLKTIAELPDQSPPSNSGAGEAPSKYTQMASLDYTRAQLAEGVDCLLFAAHYEPMKAIQVVWPYLTPAGCFAIHSTYFQPLQELYTLLREGGHAVQLVLAENWFREYQVLPHRTHPHMLMGGSGGYLLSGMKVVSSAPLNTRKRACPSD